MIANGKMENVVFINDLKSEHVLYIEDIIETVHYVITCCLTYVSL